MIGSGYTSREFCDGQSLASPDRWEPHARKYPENPCWREVSTLYMGFAQRVGTTSLLMDLALGRVEKSPFQEEEVPTLKRAVIQEAEAHGHSLKAGPNDRRDVPIDFRFLELLLNGSEDPEVAMGDFASGVRVGPGVRMPRLPKRRWKLQGQSDPLDYLEDAVVGDPDWRRIYSTLDDLSEQVTTVLEDQAERGQVLRLTEEETRKNYPHLVIASLGANRKDKPNGVVSARVLFDGSNGISDNRRTCIRDQERGPIAADLKRAMREKATTGLRTFALTADVTEAHRQVPIAECDWYLIGCQVRPGSTVYVNKVGTLGVASASYYWSRVASAIGRLAQYLVGHATDTWHMLVADDFLLEAGGPRYRAALIVFLPAVCLLRCAACLGRRQLGVTRSLGSASSCYSTATSSEYRQDGRIG